MPHNEPPHQELHCLPSSLNSQYDIAWTKLFFFENLRTKISSSAFFGNCRVKEAMLLSKELGISVRKQFLGVLIIFIRFSCIHSCTLTASSPSARRRGVLRFHLIKYRIASCENWNSVKSVCMQILYVPQVNDPVGTLSLSLSLSLFFSLSLSNTSRLFRLHH